MILPHPLTAAEVSFQLTVEPKEIETYLQLATRDVDADKRSEEAIRKRLEQGDIGAWCVLRVTATWICKATAVAYQGSVAVDESLPPDPTGSALAANAKHCAAKYTASLEDAALSALNQRIAEIIDRATALSDYVSMAYPERASAGYQAVRTR